MTARRKSEAGFTLLEVMVATLIMSIAVVGLLANLHVSLRNTERLTGYDRATQFAQHKMDELLADAQLPSYVTVEGAFTSADGDTPQGGWTALARPFEYPPHPAPGQLCLERIELQVWWTNAGRRRTLNLSGYRQHALTADEATRVAVGL